MKKFLRKLKCMFFHKHYTTKDCNIEKFENENRAITIYECIYCEKPLLIVTNHVNAKFINPQDKKAFINNYQIGMLFTNTFEDKIHLISVNPYVVEIWYPDGKEEIEVTESYLDELKRIE